MSKKKSAPRSTWGSKRERSKGCWQLRYTVGGKPRVESFRGTAKEADARLAALRVKYEGVVSSLTLGQFYETVYRPWMQDALAPKTAESYDSQWRNHIAQKFSDLALDSITPREIQQWLLTMTYSVAKHAKVALSSILSRACALDLIDDNPAQRRFQMPPKDSSKQTCKDVYTHDELDVIAEACKGENWEGCFLLAAFGGGQRSEVSGVKPGEVYMIDGFAVAPVRRGVHYIDGEVLVRSHAKNKYREEFIVVAPPYSSRLMELVRKKLANGDEWMCDDGFGRPLNPMTMAQNYQRWFSTQSYRYVPFKNLRPSYATWMRDEGYSEDDVARLLRHSSKEMLKRVYDRPRAEALVEGLLDRYGQNPVSVQKSKHSTTP